MVKLGQTLDFSHNFTFISLNLGHFDPLDRVMVVIDLVLGLKHDPETALAEALNWLKVFEVPTRLRKLYIPDANGGTISYKFDL